MANELVMALRANPKIANMFYSNAENFSYKTGFPTIDYTIGTLINVFDNEGKLIETYPSIGLTGGTYTCIFGKAATGKTTMAVQWASNIVRPFENGFVIHFDIERSSNHTRVATLSRYKIDDIKEGKYILRQLDCSLETLKKSISEIYLEKVNNPDKYKYHSGKLNEFSEEIMPYAPTYCIVDSIAAITTYVNPDTKEGRTQIGEITSQTDTMRLNGEISRFLKESLEMCKEANINIIFINHVKDKPSVGVPQQADLRYLKQNESLPCGKALQYYSSLMVRLTSVGSEKYEMNTDGFDGFGVVAQYAKSRSNIDGLTVPLVYDKLRGYDSIRSTLRFAKDNELLKGNKNGMYFINNPEKKFIPANVTEEFKNDRSLYGIMYDHVVPVLKNYLSSVSPDELAAVDEEMDY